MKNKILAFEYLLTQIIKWGNGLVPTIPESSFTRLKVLKLLFFVAAIKNDEGKDLLDVFDKFYALPNGPVESDVYNCITTDGLNYYSFSDFFVSQKQHFDESRLDNNLKDRINMSIKKLRQTNEDIIKYSAENLVMLSHYWAAWQSAIAIAKILGKGSYKMDTYLIRSCNQIFKL